MSTANASLRTANSTEFAGESSPPYRPRSHPITGSPMIGPASTFDTVLETVDEDSIGEYSSEVNDCQIRNSAANSKPKESVSVPVDDPDVLAVQHESDFSYRKREQSIVSRRQSRRRRFMLLALLLLLILIAIVVAIFVASNKKNTRGNNDDEDEGKGSGSPSNMPTSFFDRTLEDPCSGDATCLWLPDGADPITGTSYGGTAGSSLAISSDGQVLATGGPGNPVNGGLVQAYKRERRMVNFTTESSVSGHESLLMQSKATNEDWQTKEVTEWIKIGQAIQGGAGFGDSTGLQVSLSRDGTMLATAGVHNVLGIAVVRVFRFLVSNEGGSAWMQRGQDILQDLNEEESGSRGETDSFPSLIATNTASVSLSSDGNTVAFSNIVGGTFSGDPTNAESRVYSWNSEKVEWVQKGQTIMTNLASSRGAVPMHLSGSANILAIGSPLGALANVFEWNAKGVWTARGLPLIGKSESQFGRSIQLSDDGNILAISAPLDNSIPPTNAPTSSPSKAPTTTNPTLEVTVEITNNPTTKQDIGVPSPTIGTIPRPQPPLTLEPTENFDDFVPTRPLPAPVSTPPPVAPAPIPSAPPPVMRPPLSTPEPTPFPSFDLTDDISTFPPTAEPSPRITPPPSPRPTTRPPTRNPTRKPDIVPPPVSHVPASLLFGSFRIRRRGERNQRHRARRLQMSNNFIQDAVMEERSTSDTNQNEALPNAEDRDLQNSPSRGTVTIYRWDGTTWLQLGDGIFGSEGEYLGTSISMTSDGVVLAAEASGSVACRERQAKVYGWNSNKWDPRGEPIAFTSSDCSSPNSRLPASIALSNTNGLSLGDPSDGTNGLVIVHELNIIDATEVPSASPSEKPTRRPSSPQPTISPVAPTVSPQPTNPPSAKPTPLPSPSPTLSPTIDACSIFPCSFRKRPEEILGRRPFDYAGTSLSLTQRGDRLSVGAMGNSRSSGSVLIYEFDGSFWELQSTLEGLSEGENFGVSVAISSEDGTTLAVGADSFDGIGGTNTGVVRVYRYDPFGSNWVQLGRDLQGDSSFDLAGWSVALSSDGNIVAFCAPESSTGYCKVFEWDGASRNWVQQGDDIVAGKGHPGHSISLNDSGNILVIGNPDRAEASVYSFDGNDWNRLGNIIEGKGGSGFGTSVSMSASGAVIAVGAPTEGRTRIGFAAIYSFSDSRWRQVGDDIEGLTHGDHAGSAVSLSSDGVTILVGSAGANRLEGSSWSARIYDFMGEDWVMRGDRAFVGDSESFGTSSRPNFSAVLSGSAKTVAVGSARNDEAGIDAGKTNIYEYTY